MECPKEAFSGIYSAQIHNQDAPLFGINAQKAVDIFDCVDRSQYETADYLPSIDTEGTV